MDNNVISIGGHIWRLTEVDENLSFRISQTYNLSGTISRIICSRGISFEQVEDFINPKLQRLMPDPYVLKDMQKAVEKVADVVINNGTLAIIGDYDVDGATSTSILTKFFRFVRINPIIHIPIREEGYGPSDLAFDKFEKENTKLVITIDCGTTAFDVLNRATDKGFDVIVIDHHEAEVILPKVYAVVNPKRLDEDNPYHYLEYMSAVGVGFMFLVALNRELRKRNFYKNFPEPDLMQLLDLVALGTVCDVVPLLGLNRAYVRQGLKVMAKQQNIGLKNLIKVVELNSVPTSYHLGFVLGPRINACGRVGDASFGSRLLCSDNEIGAQELAEKFNQFNAERKEIENYVLLSAIEQVEAVSQEYPMAFVYGSDWHQGVIGIVAGKLKERYNVVSFVMSIEQDEVKGSARSISGIDLGALIIAAKEKGVITAGGGHIMAAGFSLTEEQIPLFKKFAGEYILERLGNEKILPIITVDSVMSLLAINESFAESLSVLEPYGADNPEPTILLKDIFITKAQIVGSGHVKCILTSPRGGYLRAISFRCADNDIGNTMLNSKGEMYNIVGKVKLDEWQGRKNVQFIIEDISLG